MLLVAIVVLGIVVCIHELGHFSVAKLLRVGVLEFSLGFGRKLISRRIGDTRYSLRLIPLGGYVRMAGDEPHAIEEQEQKKAGATEGGQESAAGPLSAPEQWGHTPDELDEVERKLMANQECWFLKKPVWAKAAIVIAGPMANLVSAFFFTIITLWLIGFAVPTERPIIGRIMAGTPAKKAGLQPLDRVISVDGAAIGSWADFAKTVHLSQGKTLAIEIERIGEDKQPTRQTVEVTGEPVSKDLEFIDKELAGTGYRIGVEAAHEFRQPIGFLDSVQGAGLHVASVAYYTVKGIVGLVLGKISLKNLAGPIFIFDETMASARKGIGDLLEFVVMISISLAVLNLLPVPVLDGGHLVFFLIEAIKGSPVSVRVMERANQIGMILLLALSALAIGNDLLRVASTF